MTNTKLRTALTAQWSRIETAPLDGREFLAVNAEKPSVTYRVVYFDDDAMEPYIWHVEDADKGFNHHRDFFTHWMPLPSPPEQEERSAKLEEGQVLPGSPK